MEMESSDSDVSKNHSGSQMDRLSREEDFYRFVNNLTEEDYKLMRDNDLLGIPGECTEQELIRRLQIIKENSPKISEENTGEGNSTDKVSPGGHGRDWLNSFRRTENLTGEQRESQSGGEVSQISPQSENIRYNLERHANNNNERPSAENEYAPSITLNRIENSQSQIENSQSESISTRLFRGEESTTGGIVQAQPIRGYRTTRGRGLGSSRNRPGIQRILPSFLVSETSRGRYYILRPWSLHQLPEIEIEMSTRLLQQETPTQQTRRHESPNRDCSVTSEIANAVQEEHSSDATNIDESLGLRQIIPNIFSHSDIGGVQGREYMHNNERQMENSPSDSIYTRPFTGEESAMEVIAEAPPTIGHRRTRDRSPDCRRIRARHQSRLPSVSVNENSQGPHYIERPWGLHQLPESEIQRSTGPQQQETPTQQTRVPELPNGSCSVTPEIRNVVQEELPSHTTSIDESLGLRQINPTRLSHPNTGRVEGRQYMDNNGRQMENSHSDSIYTRPIRGEESTTEVRAETPPSRSHRRTRDRRLHSRRSRARHQSRPPSISVSENSQRRHYIIRPLGLHQFPGSEIQRSSGPQQQETPTQQTRVPELPNGSCSVTPEIGNIMQEELPSDTTSIGESLGLRQMDPTRLSHPNTGRVEGSENLENNEQQMENSHSDSIYTRPIRGEESTTEVRAETPSRSHRRTRDRRLHSRRSRARHQNRPPSFSVSENSQRRHYIIRPLGLHQFPGSEIQRSSGPQQQETPTQQTRVPELPNRGCNVTSEIGNAMQEDHSSDATSIGESLGLRQINPTGLYHPDIRRAEGRQNMENNEQQMENSPSDSIYARPFTEEESTTEVIVEAPPTRGHRRTRDRSPDYRRTRARIQSSPPSISVSENSQGSHYIQRPWGLHQLPGSEIERSSRPLQQETTTQQTRRTELANRGCSVTSEIVNIMQEEHSSDTTSIDESLGWREINLTRLSHPEVERAQASYQENSIVNRTQLTSERPMDNGNLESENDRLSPMSLRSEQVDRNIAFRMREYFDRSLTSDSNDTSFLIHNTSEQTMTTFSDLVNLRESENNSEPSVRPSNLNIDRTEPPNGVNDSNSSNTSYNSSNYRNSNIISGFDANARFDFRSSSPLASSWSSINEPFSYIPISSPRSSDTSESSSQLSEGNDDRNLADLSDYTTESGSRSPVMFDDSDSWPSLNLDEFFLFNEDQHQSAGLTKAQIDNLAIRSFLENDTSKSCSICIMEFTEGNKIRILPCSHEYHMHCIDRWLSANTTCPICRGEVADPAAREDFDYRY